MDYDNLDQYTGDTIHDMYVDSDYETQINFYNFKVCENKFRAPGLTLRHYSTQHYS